MGSRSDESWIDISSRPSSSSLSSAADEIVTTGLRVQHDSNTRRRRRLRPSAPTHLSIPTSRPSSAGGTSSQEEYDESESESDRAMTSSSEGLALPVHYTRHATSPAPPSSASEADEEDENRTAINYPINNEHCFTPQPNAFSHPPTSQSLRAASQPVDGSYFPSVTSRPTSRQTGQRHPYPDRLEPRPQHSPYNMIAPSHNAATDHDAALRASLSTLLSCAAAARGLPKSSQRQTSHPQHRAHSTRIEPSSLRMVPESALRGDPPAAPTEPVFRPTIKRTSTTTSGGSSSDRVFAASSPTEKHKRKSSSAQRGSSKDRRSTKKARRTSGGGGAGGVEEQQSISPTLLTWVVSAGVLVLVSAFGFSAGYAMGKEAGRFEAGAAARGAADLAGCGAQEAGRGGGIGLKKLRFAGVGEAVGA
ncbi:hypothetical protein LTR66_015522 [Elasticomyces elasticus]|nr:hypothetical protein LTR66_015522 [Elasticomyces elasticus]